MLTRFEPRELLTRPFQGLQGEIERVFSDWRTDRDHRCAVDIHEDDTQFQVVADLPGWSRDDVEVTLEDGVLTLAGQRETTNDREFGSFHVRERQSGSFRRSFKLPAAVDETKVRATLKDGVLTVTLDKRDEVKARHIPVKID